MKPRFIVFLLLLVGIFLCTYFFLSNPQDQPNPIDRPQVAQQAKSYQEDSVSNNRIPISPMAKTLADPNGTAMDDLKALGDIFRYYPINDTRRLPIGTNQEITQALTKRVDLNLPFLPSNHPQIDDNGELLDRWQTPYFFHALSSERMEIRSAGPDRTLYTQDDLIWPNKKPLKNPKPIFEEAVSIR
ncbi:MAG: hypothetical protein ACSHX8_05790 [Opitutaceae bacterium]